MAEDVCPVWAGYWLACPIRKLWQNPENILSEYVKSGMTAVDLGSAMGFFTLPMARMVGDSGRVIAVDIQDKMLEKLQKRAKKKRLDSIIETHLAEDASLQLKQTVDRADFVLAFAVIHEVPDQERVFSELHAVLKKGGKLLFAEPGGHVSRESYDNSLQIAERVGFSIGRSLDIRGSNATELTG